MPVMDGIEEISEVKKRYPEIEVIILSNYDDFKYVYQGLKMGAEDYLLKAQADAEQILKIIEKMKCRKKMKQMEPVENPEERDNQIVKKIRDYIENEYKKPIKLSNVAAEFHYHPDYLSALFKKETGKNFNTYLTEIRMEKAKILLSNGKMMIREVAEAVGYANEMYFSTAFKKYTGVSPKHYLLTEGIRLGKL